MAQSYETLYILRPDLLDEQVQLQVNKYRDFLTEHNAEDIQIKTWGKRRLAYPIGKFQDGIYVQMNYKGDGNHVDPMQRAMRLSEEVIRYLTLKVKPDAVTTVPETDTYEPITSSVPVPAPVSAPVSAPTPTPLPSATEEEE
jgi:small subunit ribosomal protein S6